MCKTHEKDVRTIHRCPCPECRRLPDGAIAREHWAINRIIAASFEEALHRQCHRGVQYFTFEMRNCFIRSGAIEVVNFPELDSFELVRKS